MADFKWPDEAVVKARKWYLLDEMSCSAIARNLSAEFKVAVSRNAVIGKLNRLGVSRPPSSRKPEKAIAPPPKPAYRAPHALPAPAPLADTGAPPREPIFSKVTGERIGTAPAPLPTPELVVVGQAVVMSALKSACCKYPVGPEPRPGDMHMQLFCAAPTGDAGQVYCPEHQKIAYRPSTAAEKARAAQKNLDAAHHDMLVRNMRRGSGSTRAVVSARR